MKQQHPRRLSCQTQLVATLTIGLLSTIASAQTEDKNRDAGRSYTPDLRNADLPFSSEKGNFVVAPIPFSNPTLGLGLMGGVAYFYPQTAEQAQAQPASVSAIGALASDNGSKGYAIGHSAYWKEDRWRFSGAAAYADLSLPLLGQTDTNGLINVDWLIEGTFAYASLSRRVARNWYLGLAGRNVDIDQVFAVELASVDFELDDSFTTAGLGLSMTFDTRDMPTNAYTGRYFKASTLYTRPSLGGDLSYDAYSLAFRSYQPLADSLILAWSVTGCSRSDGVPLWDACKIGLRGLASTDYLGKSSAIGQAELRWKFSNRWGVVGFAGVGRIDESLSSARDGDSIPSYGLGLRFMIQQAKRINLRLDYGRSRDSEAVHFFVGEAF